MKLDNNILFYDDNELIVLDTIKKDIYSLWDRYSLRQEAESYWFLNQNLVEIEIDKKDLKQINLFVLNTNNLFLYKDLIPVFENRETWKFYINKKYLENFKNCLWYEQKSIISWNDEITDTEIFNFLKCTEKELENWLKSFY